MKYEKIYIIDTIQAYDKNNFLDRPNLGLTSQS